MSRAAVLFLIFLTLPFANLKALSPQLPFNVMQKNWESLSTTAFSITGNIRITEDKILFENGEFSEISLIDQNPVFILAKMTHANVKLLQGNTLCDEQSGFLVLHSYQDKFDKKMQLSIDVFCGDERPSIQEIAGDSDNVSGSYSYVLSADQSAWRPHINIETSRENAAAEDACSNNHSPVSDPAGWKKCTVEQISARQQINDIDRKLGSYDLHSSCTHYVTGGRSLGSMEYIDSTLILSCMKGKNPDQRFSNCVKQETGRTRDSDEVFWDLEAAEKISFCFNDIK